MRKAAALFAMVLLTAAVQPAWAGGHGHHRRHHYHYAGHRGCYPWAAWGFGLLTGATVSYLVYLRPYTVGYPVHPAAVGVPAPAAPPAATTPTAPPPDVMPYAETARASVGSLNVRSGPGTHHPVVALVGQGESLSVIGHAPGWLDVRTASGRYGWVMARYTLPIGPLG